MISSTNYKIIILILTLVLIYSVSVRDNSSSETENNNVVGTEVTVENLENDKKQEVTKKDTLVENDSVKTLFVITVIIIFGIPVLFAFFQTVQEKISSNKNLKQYENEK